MALLEIKNITGGYTRNPVLKDVSFEVEEKEIVGLIGLNGAGKSTTIKHVIGLMEPQSGEITINGNTFHKDKEGYRRQFTFVPETPILYDELTLKEHLEMTAMAYGILPGEYKERMEKLLKEFRMEKRLKWFPAHFSKGMKQKVMIMQAMLENTDLLILDEPLSGLDPKAQSDLEETLSILKDNGLSIVLTCHETKLLQHLVDTVFVIQNNKIIQTDSLNSNQTQHNRLIFDIGDLALLENLYPFLDILEQNQLNSDHFEIVTVIKLEDTNRILEDLLRKNVSIKQLMPVNYQEEHFYNQF